ncbi:hypothetical protein LINPERPRIM_LOCUS4699 [Linum perenne]
MLYVIWCLSTKERRRKNQVPVLQNMMSMFLLALLWILTLSYT